jgi:hypothetical protein
VGLGVGKAVGDAVGLCREYKGGVRGPSITVFDISEL